MSDELSIQTTVFAQIAEKLREYNVKIDEQELNEMFTAFMQGRKSADTDAFVREIENRYGIVITEADRLALRQQGAKFTLKDVQKPSNVKKTSKTAFPEVSKEPVKVDENLQKLISNGSINTALSGVLKNIVDTEEKNLKSVKENCGKISGLWNSAKNLLHIGTGSDKVQEKIDASKEKLALLKSNPEKLPEVYREITGNTLNTEEIDAIYNGNVDYSKSDIINSVTKYTSSQKSGINVISGLTSALSITGVVLSGAIAAPFTGGLSLGASMASLGILGATGAAGYMIPQALDGLTEKDGYSGREILEDTAHALLNGTVNALSAGVGNAVGSAIGTSAAGSAAASTAESALGETASLALNSGSTAAKLLQTEAAALTAGNGMAAGEYIIDTATDSEHDFSLKELGKTLLTASSASLVAGATAAGSSSAFTRALTTGASSEGQVFGKILSGALTGAAAGSTGAMAAGSADYIFNCLVNGEEATFDEWLEATSKNVKTGALTGFASGMAFEAVHLASGAAAPEGYAEVREGTTEDGLKYTEYVDSDGNVIARDFDSDALSEYMNNNSENKQVSAQTSNKEPSKVRITFDGKNQADVNASQAENISETAAENVAGPEPRPEPKPAPRPVVAEPSEIPADIPETSTSEASESVSIGAGISNNNSETVSQIEPVVEGEEIHTSDNRFLSVSKRYNSGMISPDNTIPVTEGEQAVPVSEVSEYLIENEVVPEPRPEPKPAPRPVVAEPLEITADMPETSTSEASGSVSIGAGISNNNSETVSQIEPVIEGEEIHTADNSFLSVSKRYNSGMISPNNTIPVTEGEQAVPVSEVSELPADIAFAPEPKAAPRPEPKPAFDDSSELIADLPESSVTEFQESASIGSEFADNNPESAVKIEPKTASRPVPVDPNDVSAASEGLSDAELPFEYDETAAEMTEDCHYLSGPVRKDVPKISAGMEPVDNDPFPEISADGVAGVTSADAALIEEKIPISDNNAGTPEIPAANQNASASNDYTSYEAGTVVNLTNEQVKEREEAQNVNYYDNGATSDNTSQPVNVSYEQSERTGFSPVSGSVSADESQVSFKSDGSSSAKIDAPAVKKANISAKQQKYIGDIVRQKISANKHITSVSEKNISEIINAVNSVHNYCVNLGINISFENLSDLFDKLEYYDNPSKFTNMFFSMNQTSVVKTIVLFLMQDSGFFIKDLKSAVSVSAGNQSITDIIGDIYSGDDISDKKAELQYIEAMLISAVKNGKDIDKIKSELLKYKNRYDLSANSSTEKNALMQNSASTGASSANSAGAKTSGELTTSNFSGLKYIPEEDTKKVTYGDANTATETIYSKDKEVKIQTTVRYDRNSNPAKITSVHKSQNMPGCYETRIYGVDSKSAGDDIFKNVRDGKIKNGKSLSYTKKKEDGSVVYKEKINYRHKSTEKNYTVNDKSKKYSYTMKSDDDNKIIEVKRRFSLSKNGSSTTVVNGKKYRALFDNKGLTVNISCDDGNKVFIDLNRELTGFSPEQKSNLFEALKNVPGDSMFQIKTAIKYYGNKSGILSNKNAKKYTYYGNKGNLTKNTEFDAFLNVVLAENLTYTSIELNNIFRKEMNKFKKENPELAKNFLKNSHYLVKADGDECTAVVAESNDLLRSPETKPESGLTRTQILEMYFSETIFAIANLTGINSVKYA